MLRILGVFIHTLHTRKSRNKDELYCGILELEMGFARLRTERWRGETVHRTVSKHAPFKSLPNAPQNKNSLGKAEAVLWSWKWDLNPRPIDYESIALPLRHSSKF